MESFALSNYLTITRIFSFEMAHALSNHQGLCKNLHGHSYKLHITLTGDIKHDDTAPDDGMLIDFGELKKIVNHYILNRFDHALVVYNKAPYAENLKKLAFERIEILNFQPTCENLIIHFARLLVMHLPEHLRLHRLRLYETENSYAEWHA